MSTEVTAPMSGSVLKIHVKVGDQVSLDDELMVLEAMKMENPIYAPIGGNIAEIKIAEGAKVEANQLLLVIK